MTLRKAFDKDSLLASLSRAKASQQFSQVNGQELTKTELFKCSKCLDEEGKFVKVEQEMVVQGELKTVLVDAWRPCECVEARSVERKFKSSKISDEFMKMTFDVFRTVGIPAAVQFAYQMANVYAANFQTFRQNRANSICMLGNPGSGKTHLLTAIANRLMSQNVQVLYFPWVEGFNEIKDDLSMMDERINKLQRAEVLFIDDMWKGRKAPTEFQIEQAFAIINYRYMEKKPVLISSERSISQMCDIDEAIGSRINEMCKDFRIVMSGGRELNYRLREDESA